MSDEMMSKHSKNSSENVGLIESERRMRKPRRLTKLTSRDLDILEFLIEMKFSNLSQLHRKFFLTLENGERSRSEIWAQERLRALRKLGLVELKPVFLNESYFYLATQFGQECLQNLRPERNFVRALDTIDHRTFVHDRLVVDARLRLENLGRAHNWRSERRLKSESTLAFGLAREYQPDAIYQNRRAEFIAFELENVSKTKARYEDKIRKYVTSMYAQAPDQPRLTGVLFVVVNEANFQTLLGLTKPYAGKFKIERYEDLMNSTIPPSLISNSNQENSNV